MVKKNIPHEQNLVDEYVKYLQSNEKIILKNQKCRSKSHADLEYIHNDVLWIIEAKSHESKDAYNSVHKLFGELLKETGRKRELIKNEYNQIKYGLLIPADKCGYTSKSGLEFYKGHFKEIDKEKYINFGRLIPIEDIFIFSITEKKATKKTWNEFIE